MLLPIFLWILASTNASLLKDAIDKIPKLNPLEKIQEIPDVLTSAVPEDAKLTTMELIAKYGYKGELYKVTTSDGYILEMHRIAGRADATDSKVQKPVAFLMHGLLCDSSAWVLAGREKSLAFILADEGFDVWLGNARGNSYAHTHKSRKISKKDYWDFSWNEIGTNDLPAMIDQIVKTTGRKKMFYIGHSQGTTSFFVMASQKPKYQEYIQEMYALAPIAYSGRMKSPLMQLMSQFSTTMTVFRDLIGYYEFDPSNDFTRAVQQIVCAEKAITQPICSNLMFMVTGFNPEQLDPALIPVIMGHVPAPTASKQFLHYAQLIHSGMLLLPGRFKNYDHGLSNKKVYGALLPPSYDVTKIKAPVYLYYSENDWLANVLDVEKLYKELGNPSGKYLIPDKKFNHVDYMWATDGRALMWDHMISRMKKASQ